MIQSVIFLTNSVLRDKDLIQGEQFRVALNDNLLLPQDYLSACQNLFKKNYNGPVVFDIIFTNKILNIGRFYYFTFSCRPMKVSNTLTKYIGWVIFITK